MTHTPLSLSLRTLHAELRELAVALAPLGGPKPRPGSVVRKRIRGGTFIYYQYRDLSGHTRQSYLGPERDVRTESLLDALERGPDPEDRARIDELHRAYVAGGAPALDHAPMRVLDGFADAGVIQPVRGASVVVGTYAFAAYAHLLGVRWASGATTQDIDIAGSTRAPADALELAVTAPKAQAPAVLERLEMGFLPVPTLDPRAPSTSYKVRGRELRVDLLAPARDDNPERPVHVPALGAMATPLPMLDYLLEDPVAGLMVGRRGIVLAALPTPERFAIHKLAVARSRPSAFATKASKDLLQARAVLAVLAGEAPLGVGAALSAFDARGPRWRDRLESGIDALEAADTALATWLREERARS